MRFGPHALAFLAAVHATVVGLAQEAVFRADTTLLELEVRVSDERGRTIDSLSSDDFAIFENGQPRPIASFEYVREPGSRWPAGEIRPAHISRLLILLDAPPEDLGRAIPFVRTFLRERLPEGLLVSLNGLAFTADREMLVEQLERRSWTRDALATAGTSALDPAMLEAKVGQVENYSANLVDDQFGRAQLYRYLEIVGALARYQGRKSITPEVSRSGSILRPEPSRIRKTST